EAAGRSVSGAEFGQGLFAGPDLADLVAPTQHGTAHLGIQRFMIKPKPLEYAGHYDGAAARVPIADLDRYSTAVSQSDRVDRFSARLPHQAGESTVQLELVTAGARYK